jgi:hypothetical protein
MTHAVTFDMSSTLPHGSDSHLFPDLENTHVPMGNLFGLLVVPDGDTELQLTTNAMELDGDITQSTLTEVAQDADLENDNENEIEDPEGPTYEEGTISA